MNDIDDAVATLTAELEAATALASDEVRAALPAIARALRPALTQIRQDMLIESAEDLNASGITSGLYVRMGSSGPEFATDAPSPAPDVSDDEPMVRLTLRLPQGLRDAILGATRDSGQSLNSWLVAAASDNLARSYRSTKRLSGWSI